MEKFVIIFMFFIMALLFMGISLHFSRYKKRKTGGCGCAQEQSSKGDARSESCPVCSGGGEVTTGQSRKKGEHP